MIIVNPFQVAPSGRTYAEFQAHIATLATGGVVSWTATTGSAYPTGVYRTTSASPTGLSMRGSPWSSIAGGNLSAVGRLVQHSMGSQASFDAIVAVGGEVLIQTTVTGDSNIFTSLNRNGYNSQDSSFDQTEVRIVRCLYFEPSIGAFETNPSTGTGPTAYVF